MLLLGINSMNFMRRMKMVTKEEVEKARATWEAAWEAAWIAAHVAADAEEEAWDKYVKLKREYEDGIKSTED